MSSNFLLSTLQHTVTVPVHYYICYSTGLLGKSGKHRKLIIVRVAKQCDLHKGWEGGGQSFARCLLWEISTDEVGQV